MRCAACGYKLLAGTHERCSECGLHLTPLTGYWSKRLFLRTRDFVLMLVVVPVLGTIPPLVAGVIAQRGAGTFETAYLLTLPVALIAIVFSALFAVPIAWRVAYRWHNCQSTGEPPPFPGWIARVVAFLFLVIIQCALFLLILRIGFALVIQPSLGTS